MGGIVLGGGRLHLRLGSGGRAGECSLELPPPIPFIDYFTLYYYTVENEPTVPAEQAHTTLRQ